MCSAKLLDLSYTGEEPTGDILNWIGVTISLHYLSTLEQMCFVTFLSNSRISVVQNIWEIFLCFLPFVL